MRRLIIRPGAIGDCILSFPAMEHLASAPLREAERDKLPNRFAHGSERRFNTITSTEVWVPSAVVPLIQFADQVRSIASTSLDLLGIPDVEIADSLLARLESFDSIVSWYGSKRPEFRAAILSINPNCEFHAALPQDFSGHATDFFATQVGGPMGLSPRIRVDEIEPRDSIVIHPFSGSKPKNWPLERFRELAALLPYEVEWLAGPEENLAEAKRIENLADVARFIAGARLYIGNDSGVTHLAAAVGVKTIAIFGPKSPRIWVPRGDNVEVIAVGELTDLKPDFVAGIASPRLDSRLL